MTRTCKRPGCDRPAATRLSYDTVSCQVWLDPLPEFAGRDQEICALHSSRLTVPRGWSISNHQLLRPTVDDAPAPDAPDADAAVTDAVVPDAPVPDAPVSDAPVSDVAVSDATVVAAGEGGAPERRTRRDRARMARMARTAPVGQDSSDASEGDPDTPPGGTQGEDELPDALQATSPLLSRAFRSTGHQRSVITQALGDQD
jgi:hypothetical protein